MSNDIQAEINATLGVKCCKTMFLGATLMDTSPEAGYDGSMTNVKHEFEWSPHNALLLYPEVRDIESKEQEDSKVEKKVDLSMACAWNTGFMPSQRGLPDATNMGRKTNNFLAGRSIITTDQVFKARGDSVLAALFPHFSWYGSNGVRMVAKENAVEEAAQKVVRKGLVSPSWLEKPLPVRYMVRIPPEAGEPDYVYFIGGSQDVIGDDLEKIPASLTAMYDQIRLLKEEAKKASSSKSKKSDDKNSFQATPKYLWWSYSGGVEDPLVKASVVAKKLLRTIEAIFFIRNYLVYAEKYAGISEIHEIGWDAKAGVPTFKEVEIQKIAAKYDTIYAYCKNLCAVYPDIAKGDIL
jgi:hypothetical protein